MKLYSSTTSPFVRKVRLVALELGVHDRIELVQTITTPLEPSAELGRVNPLIKLPTLLTDDGEQLFDSRVIVEYLLSLVPEQLLLPASGPSRFAALRIQALADGLLDAAIAVFYEQRFRLPEQRFDKWMQAQTRKADAALVELDRSVASWSSYFDVGAIAVLAAVRWIEFREVLPALAESYPSLMAWADTHRDRASVVATVPYV